VNHAEEAAFWYLRLNGFFAITNFVIHASREVVHTSDCDVLAVRLPYVYEEIGGQDDDWDPFLRHHLNLARPIGVVCEVKSGRYDTAQLFRENNLRYTLARLGFVPRERVRDVAARMLDQPVIELEDGTQLAKLLIARHERAGPFLTLGLTEVERFLQARVEKYPKQKYGDRMFFGPVLFQTVIELTAAEPGQE
jgi:hypothetical protein